MAGNGTSECVISAGMGMVQSVAWLVAYYVVMPIYFLLGLGGNVTLLVAFNRQATNEKAYAYQLFLTCTKIMEIVTFSLFMFTYKWFSGVEAPGSAWFMSNYPLMFFSTHLASPLFNGFIMISLLLSVAMTTDRVFALACPFQYRNIDHKAHQKVALIVCCGLGVVTNIFEVKRWRLIVVDQSYTGEFDEAYLSTMTAMALGHLRTAVRLTAVLALIVLNVIMVASYKKQNKKVGPMLARDKKEMQRRANEKTLLILTVYQSSLTCFSQVPHSAHLVASFAWAWYGPCYGTISGPFVDTCIQLADTADFFLIILINKQMRRAVLSVIPKWLTKRMSSS